MFLSGVAAGTDSAYRVTHRFGGDDADHLPGFNAIEGRVFLDFFQLEHVGCVLTTLCATRTSQRNR